MALATFDPGAFSARLILEMPEAEPDGQGGAADAFSAVATLWARVEPVSGLRDEEAASEPMTVTHRIWLRHRGDISGDMRFRKGGRIFAIRAFRDPDESRRYLVCHCEEVGR
ncbi:phage head closure protein [Sinorhizobium sp. BG8]|uniref:phage head closure protein n=1 Tax=Sinorhizobium sp. BG8 TaxID=2613773 RepID=UPI00193CF5DE|nr:phage head closure protein [Sinorhizobium sp. BG8]QRM54753.1 phage head closure protein [Sinorhizobium sp. BG8]